ncbi:MAG: gas vesicle protein GvpD basic region 2 domain-containing protein [Halobacteria archaeon]
MSSKSESYLESLDVSRFVTDPETVHVTYTESSNVLNYDTVTVTDTESDLDSFAVTLDVSKFDTWSDSVTETETVTESESIRSNILFSTLYIYMNSSRERGRSGRAGFSTFPVELEEFFLQDHGRTLLVKGEAGAGKTMFAMQTIDHLSQRRGDVLYISTHIDKDRLYETHIRDRYSLNESDIIDLSRQPFKTPFEIDFPFDKLDRENFLEWIKEIGAVSDHLTLVIDSIELIHQFLVSDHPYGNGESSSHSGKDRYVLNDKLASLARQRGIDIVLVSENYGNTELDYIVDGVVEMKVDGDASGRAIRKMVLEKLRGVKIDNRVESFTLSGGRFSTFVPVELTEIYGNDVLEVGSTEETKVKFSTGIPEFDDVLEGGYNRGSVIHLELGINLSRNTWGILTFPLIRNFIFRGNAAGILPPQESSPGIVRKNVGNMVSEDRSKELCKVYDTYPDESYLETDDELTIDRVENFSQYIESVNEVREDSDGPVLHIISLDTLDKDDELELGDYANYTALHNDLSVLMTKQNSDMKEEVGEVADMHFKLKKEREKMFLMGKNPVTPYLGIVIDRSDEVSEIGLKEMV